MNDQAKQLYEKMVDYKRFSVILLAVGAFFYLGVILPSNTAAMGLNIRMIASTSFIAVSLFFSIQSKQCRTKLLELEEDEEYDAKK